MDQLSPDRETLSGGHLDEELLRRVLEGGAEPREVLRQLLEHLLALCPTCRASWHAVSGRLPAVPGTTDYAPALDGAVARAARRAAELERELAEAERQVAELVALPVEEQLFQLSTESRLQRWGVCSRLIEESRQAAKEEPSVAEGLGHLAVMIAGRLDEESYGAALVADIRARAWRQLGNARRITGDFAAASEALAQAESHQASGSGDPLEMAELLQIKASLLRDRGRFTEALALLDNGEALYRRCGERRLQGRVLIKRATILRQSGRPEEAVGPLRQALDLIDPAADPYLALCGRHNLVLSSVDCGRFEAAEKLLLEAADLYDGFSDRSTQLRRSWAGGRIARGLGRADEAARLFTDTRQGFLDLDLGYDAALVSLDLAGLHLERGELDRVQRLAAEMLPIFRSRDVHREALAALVIFQQAATARTLSAGMAQEIADYLRRARRDPNLRYEQPS